jgi:hypothetical protein
LNIRVLSVVIMIVPVKSSCLPGFLVEGLKSDRPRLL